MSPVSAQAQQSDSEGRPLRVQTLKIRTLSRGAGSQLRVRMLTHRVIISLTLAMFRKEISDSYFFQIRGQNVALSKRVWSKSYWFLPSTDLARWMHFVLIRATRSAMAPLPRSTRPWSSFVKTADSSTKSWRRWSRVTPWQEMVRFLKYPHSRVFSIISTSRGKCFRLRVVWWGHLWRGCC